MNTPHPFRKLLGAIILGLIWGTGVVFSYQLVTQSLSSPQRIFADTINTPSHLIIPRLTINAPIRPVGLDTQGNMQTAGDATHVAWYEYGPHPGMAGAAVIDGHLDTKYQPQAVFYHLDDLNIDDEIYIQTTEGKIVAFRVVSKKEYPYDAKVPEIFTSSDITPKLNLITCSGEWLPDKKTYSHRLVIFTERIR